MTTFLGEFKFRVSGCDSDEAFEEHLDQVLEFLADDERLIDPDYTAALALRKVEFSLSAAASEEGEAFALLHSALRAAIHAAEGCTPGWENHFEQMAAHLRKTDLVDA